MTDTVERMLPLYEAKMIHQFDHRWATYEPDGTVRDVTLQEKHDRAFVALPCYWVREEVVADRLEGRSSGDWLLGWRDICRSTDERSLIATQLPVAGVGNKVPLILGESAEEANPILQAVLSSFVCDFVARQKLGGITMNFYILKQIAVATMDAIASRSTFVDGWPWIANRVQRLNSWADTAEVRARVRAELDGLMFHIYGLSRDEVDYVMDTFPIVKRKDEAAHGSFVTKKRILAVYNDMQIAIDSGEPYESPLEPELARAARVTADEGPRMEKGQ